MPKREKVHTMSRHTPIEGTRHICSLCGKPRSLRYQRSHPLLPGQIPKAGTCSRRDCRSPTERLSPPPCSHTITLEIHHYYHSNIDSAHHPTPAGVIELPGQSSLSGRIELPTAPFHPSQGVRRLSPISEEPPPVRYATKPTLQECRIKRGVRF